MGSNSLIKCVSLVTLAATGNIALPFRRGFLSQGKASVLSRHTEETFQILQVLNANFQSVD